MLYSILQIIAFQALFLLVYDLFLKRETFFNYNRAYLLVSSALSLVLPFIKFPELKKMATENIVIQLPEVFIGTKAPSSYEIHIAEQAGIIMEQPQTPIWQSVLLIGIVLASLIFLFKIGKLYWLKHRNPKRWQGNVLIVKLIKSSAAFSFFNTIFLGERIPETEKATIYKHELVHVKELHSLDLLFFELLRIVFWFNPLVYIYQNRIKELHEYIADAKAVKQNGKSAYYESLLKQVFDVNNVSFTNTFFKKSLIKKRIAMLQKTKSRQIHLTKYAFLIPMILGMLVYTSAEVRAQQKTKSNKEVHQELTDAELVEKNYTSTEVRGQQKTESKKEVYQESTDAELIAQYYNEFLVMKKDGATFFEISDYAGLKKNNYEKYLLSRNEFLKIKAYMNYIADGIIKRKSEEGTLTQDDIDEADIMRLQKFETYNSFREFKNTDEAKTQWESITRDGVLRMFVKEIGNQSTEEKKRLDGLLKQLESDDAIEKIIMTDGEGTFVIEDYHSSNSDTKVEKFIEVPFTVIDEAPTLVECKDVSINDERKKCINEFINKHVNKNFNISLADSLGPGRKRIFVQFKIDTEGHVKSIKARAPSEALEDEAERVLKTLPQFVPGRQNGELVTVPFSLPIVFEIAGDGSEETPISYTELVTQRDRILKNSSEKNPVVIQLNRQIEVLKTERNEKEVAMTQGVSSEKTKEYERFLNQVQKDSIKQKQIPFSVVEEAPIHPDCVLVSDNEMRRKCTSDAISKLVNKNFNMDLAQTLGLTGRNKIYASFNITKEGDVSIIKARAEHPKMVEEVKRVINLLPKFSPGSQDGDLVDVTCSLPIVFEIAERKKD